TCRSPPLSLARRRPRHTPPAPDRSCHARRPSTVLRQPYLWQVPEVLRPPAVLVVRVGDAVSGRRLPVALVPAVQGDRDLLAASVPLSVACEEVDQHGRGQPADQASVLLAARVRWWT